MTEKGDLDSGWLRRLRLDKLRTSAGGARGRLKGQYEGWGGYGERAAYIRRTKEAMMDKGDLDQLTKTGSVPQDVYRIMRDAIQKAGEQKGRLYDEGHEAHYMALAAAMSLRAAGYSIEKVKVDA